MTGTGPQKQIRIKVPKGIDPKVLEAGLDVLTLQVLPLVSTHEGRLLWLKRAKKDGWPGEYSHFADDDKLLDACLESFWWAFEKVVERGVKKP